MSARLAVNLIRKSFGARVIARDICFEVNAGEVVAILGASGCGKTTLLRIIAGLERDYEGEVVVDNNANNNANRNGVVGVVYQEPRLMPWLTVEENIAFAQAASDKGYTKLNSSIDGLLQEVLLEDARQYWPKQLSGGMAQRVTIARADCHTRT